MGLRRILLASIVVVAWVATAWWQVREQYYLPAEDAIWSPWCVPYAVLGGIAVAALMATSVSFRWASALVVTPVLLDLPLLFALSPVLLSVAWLARRYAERHIIGREAGLAVLAVVAPMILALASVQPLTSYLRWNWPWLSFRAPIRKLLADADRAADALGLPRDRGLTRDEIAALEARTPLRMTLDYPFAGRPISVSVLYAQRRMPEGEVYLWWGGPNGRPTFGPLDTTWMIIGYASD